MFFYFVSSFFSVNREFNKMSKLDEIKDIINTDHLSADVKVSLFTSAAISFKRDSLLSPFPKLYLVDGVKNFEKLTVDVNKIPSLEEFLVLLMSDNASFLPKSVIELLHWILTSPKYTIHTVPRSNFDQVLTLSKVAGSSPSKPTHIFKINYIDSGAESRFKQLKETLGRDTKYAYHGTRFYNIYSILNYGLQQHLNKTGLFGEGLYFSQELDVSLLFSPSVLGWSQSKCGNVMGCVAVCEYIDDPLHVKIRKENAKNADIPQSYLLITNNEFVRVRYLLVYGSKKSMAAKKPPPTADEQVEDPQRTRNFFRWCRKNPLIVSVFLYIMMLFFVGISKHRAVEYYKNIVIRFLQNRFKFL